MEAEGGLHPACPRVERRAARVFRWEIDLWKLLHGGWLVPDLPTSRTQSGQGEKRRSSARVFRWEIDLRKLLRGEAPSYEVVTGRRG